MTRLIALFAPNLDGHRATYVRHLLTHCPEAARVLLITTPSGVAAPGFDAQVAPNLGNAGVEVSERAELKDAERIAIRRGAFQMVAIDGDYLAATACARRSPRVDLTLLVMRAFVQPRASRIATLAFDGARAAAIHCASKRRRLAVKTLVAPYEVVSPRFGEAVVDPVELSASAAERELARERFQLSSDVRWVGLAGAISQRKRPELVLEAAQGVGNVGVFLAGPLDAESRLLVRRWRERGLLVVTADGYLSDRDLDLAVASLDALVVTHTNRGPSGMLAKAMSLGTFAIVGGAPDLADVAAKWSSVAFLEDVSSKGLANLLRGRVSGPVEPAGFDQSASPLEFVRGLLA